MAKKTANQELPVTFADVYILCELYALESVLLKSTGNPYLGVNVQPLLDKVQRQVGILCTRIREKMDGK